MERMDKKKGKGGKRCLKKMTWDLTPELADAICEAIATTPRGLDHICRARDDFPSARTVHTWLGRDAEFLQKYLRAREAQADLIFDECLEIADDKKPDFSFDPERGLQVDGDHIQRCKLRIDTRMRMAGKLHPKKYGDKQTIEHEGNPDKPLVTKIERTIVDPKHSNAPGIPTPSGPGEV